MTQVKTGDTVHIHYTGTLTDGTVFDSSEGREPLSFEVGSGQIIPGLDAALPGMTPGEKKHVEIGMNEAYGPHHPEGRMDVPLEQLPPDLPREVGITLGMRNEQGQEIPVTVVAVSDTHMTLDANHPLAGKDLIFDIELVSVD
ncbi:MAG: peptidylprolyl isomerase [Alphaproteobacteria bacterium]|nr:MAG: peptidylprolyl isomerase [Alphaproteobacteria bacterium]